MRAGEQPGFAGDRADGQAIASVGAATFVQDHGAHFGLDLGFKRFGNVRRLVRADERGNHFMFERVHRFVAFRLDAFFLDRRSDAPAQFFGDGVFEFVAQNVERKFFFRFAQFRAHFFLQLDHGLHRLVPLL